MAAYRYASEISYANVTQDNLRMQELENENDGLRYELQRLKGQLEKEQGKAKRLEREN